MPSVLVRHWWLRWIRWMFHNGNICCYFSVIAVTKNTKRNMESKVEYTGPSPYPDEAPAAGPTSYPPPGPQQYPPPSQYPPPPQQYPTAGQAPYGHPPAGHPPQPGYGTPQYGAALAPQPPQEQQQLRQEVMVSVGEQQHLITVQQVPSYIGHIFFACFVSWCCNFVFGVNAFTLAG